MSVSLLVAAALALAGDDPATELWPVLAARDAPPACAALFEGRDAAQVRAALVSLVGNEVRPPWVPMRAARCLIEEQGSEPEVVELVGEWMVDPAVPGLALVVVGSLDELPVEVAVELAGLAVERAGREPRFALHARPALERSAHPEVVELAPLVRVAD